MKKNFVKYFGVASTTLLAVAPVATPALMTASNLTVVKAGVQDDITAAFKADNSLVQLSDDQWKGLTSTIVSYAPDAPISGGYSQTYLDQLKKYAEAARLTTAQNAKAAIKDSGSFATPATPTLVWSAITNASTVGSTSPLWNVKTYTLGDGRVVNSIRPSADITFNKWNEELGEVISPATAVTPKFSMADIFGTDFATASNSYTDDQIAERAYRNILKLPLWTFISGQELGNEIFKPIKGMISDKVNGGSDTLFEAFPGAKELASNGLVTVAPDGGVVPVPSKPEADDYTPDNQSLAYVGDNLVDLQKHTDLELFNLIPSSNQGGNRTGTPFSKVQGQFKVSGGTVTASGKVSDGSKVWTTILQGVLNPKDAMYPLYNLTSSNVTKTKMLVNGKDATKNQYITKDEIQNADRISIQFVFKTNDGSEYKSPTIWLTHGNKYTVNTAGLANVTRLPGDFYQPSAGITGTFNETGLPMDSKKFVVVPAGTDLSYYTNKDGMVNLTNLAALQGGILGTNGVAVDREGKTAFEGGKLDSTQYWTTPNYIYSKFGSYNDAVDIYYIDGTLKAEDNLNSTEKSKTRAESKTEAANAVKAKLNAELARYSDNNAQIPMQNIWDLVENTVGQYVSDGTDVKALVEGTSIYWNLQNGSKKPSEVFFRTDSATNGTNLVVGYLKNSNATYPVARRVAGTPAFTGTVDSLFGYIIESLPTEKFKEEVKDEVKPVSKYLVPSYQLNKVVANAARTTKVDVPSKYLPQVSFNNYKGATYYGNGATINNWFNYDWNSGSASGSGNNPYYPSGGIIVTGGTSAASSSAAKQPTSYLAPAAFAANSISADQLQARVTDNIQRFMSAKLSNPNTQSDSNINGYFKGYPGKDGGTGDAAFAYIKNGAVPASDVKVDTSKVDVTKPGTYYVEVTYTPVNTIKSNTFDGNLGATNGNVDITDANGKLFEGGRIGDKPFSTSTGSGATVASTGANASTVSDSLTTFAADQIFANGAPATYKLPVQITDGSNAPQSGAPVIAFTEGGQNLKIAKGGTFDQFKGLQFYAYPGAKAWDQKDDSVKVEVSGKVNTNVEGTYTLVYTVTNKAGKSSTLTRVITVGDGVEKPTEYELNLSQAYIDYVPGYNVREYGYPGNEWTGKQIKHGTSVSVTRRAVFQNGEEWYKLGDGNWVKKQYVKAGQNPSEAVDARGVVTVNYVPGYGIAVYKEPGKSALVQVNGKAKRLAHGTSWKSFKKQTVNNVTYYNVGGNQWVNGNFVIFK